MPCVYVIFSKKTTKLYTGSSRKDTADIRLAAHNAGKTKSTKSGRPWQIVHTEVIQNYTEARKREFFLKSGAGRKQIIEKLAITNQKLWRDGRAV